MPATMEECRRTVKNNSSGKAGKKDLERLLEDDQESKPKLPILPVHNFLWKHIESMFRLKWTESDRELKDVPRMHLPTELSVLRTISATYDTGGPPEPYIRTSLSMLLIYAQYYARAGNTPLPLRVKPAGIWRYGPVKNCYGIEHTLSGKPDYGVWYGEEETTINLVVMEAKRNGGWSCGVAPCLTYMGMAHRLQKKQGRKDCTVYGMSADHRDFCFLKINNNSEWSQHLVYGVHPDYEQVFGLLVHFLRKASLVSASDSKE